ncbi:MAG: hypothetical protein IJ094_08240 [Bacilli bacterium]|nr:hypothetical protein [Bacilli bacterium]
MENQKNSNFSRYFALFIKNTVMAMIIWPLVGLFFAVVIYKKEFIYSTTEYIFSPIMFGIFSVVFTKLLDNRKKNNQ